jgi:hypothetical protein
MLGGPAQVCTKAIMLAHGFVAELLVGLVRFGLTTIAPGIM